LRIGSQRFQPGGLKKRFAVEGFENFRIAILDDDPQVRKTLAETLRGWGLGAEGFDRVEALQEHISENGCDIVLFDISMSGLCGGESPVQVSALPLLESNARGDSGSGSGASFAGAQSWQAGLPPAGSAFKIIFTARSADQKCAVRALKLDAFDLLEKPFQNDLLYHSILRALKVLESERQTKRLIEELEQSRVELLARQRRLESLNAQLFGTSRAMSVLASNFEREREEMEGQIAIKLRNLLMPIVTKLRNEESPQEQKSQLDMLTWHLEHLTSGSSVDTAVTLSLSSAETRIASLVKNGLSTDEIARQLHISEKTVRSHRRNIRKKLKIDTQYSLRNYLDSRGCPRKQISHSLRIYLNSRTVRSMCGHPAATFPASRL
jgi:FixJ family two-component response regulator